LKEERDAAPLLREVLDSLRRGKDHPDPLAIARRLREAKDRNMGGRMLRSVGNPKEALRWQAWAV
jgi:hypothetical protein